jgi:hypothetical protein
MAGTALGQVDPELRELLQAGFTQSVQGASPVAAYGYYYLNEPNFLHTNVTLRLALAPVYLDSEVGLVGLLGPNTDLGIGLAGGGYADNYYEFQKGKYLPEQSFHGRQRGNVRFGLSSVRSRKAHSVVWLLRVKEHYSFYQGNDELSPGSFCRTTIRRWIGARACAWADGNRCSRRLWPWNSPPGTKDSFVPPPALTAWTATVCCSQFGAVLDARRC